MPLLYLSECTIRNSVTQAQVCESIESMYAAIARGEARNFPTVREDLHYADAVFGFKSGFEPGRRLLGLKAGGLWPGNGRRELDNHQSTILLFDPECGEPLALVRANYLTALRTAAASTISIRYLARKDSAVLGIIGAGGQAEHQVLSAVAELAFRVVYVADSNAQRAAQLAARLRESGIEASACENRELVERSDVVITITPSRAPVIRSSWVRPGTHIACMGADTRGKQEIEAELVERASLFVDDSEQSVSIGEFQHAFDDRRIGLDDLVFIGDVITGAAAGRTSEQQVTVFDSSGVGLQDLVAARLALDLAVAEGDIGELGQTQS